MRRIASLTAPRGTVDPESIAQERAEAVANTGDGPFERLGTANAIITASGRLMACTR
jgi:hypothetical protein